MKIRSLMAAVFISLIASPAFAGGNHADGHTHEHNISSRAAEQRAQKVVAQLIDKKVLEASWQGVKPSEAAQKTAAGKKLWQVVFKNPAAADPAKQTLYVFLSGAGKYLAANHSGKY